MEEEWSGSPVKRSYAHYEDDRDDTDDRDERDDRSDRDHREGREDRQDRDGSRHKRRRGSDSEVSGYGTSDIEYRILCPISKIGAVIGKGGSIIKSLRLDTKAKIKVEDVIHGSDERVIYLSSAPGRGRDGRSRDRDGRRGPDKDEMVCPAQEALFRIHHCITQREDDVPASDEEHDEDDPPPQVTIRLLVPDSQVGCLIGKGGRIIEQMRKDIAAQIRVLPKASLPPCAYPNDELVQLSGTPAVVKKALHAVSSKLYENPVRERSHRSSGVAQGAGGGMYPLSFHAPGPMMGMGHHGRSGTGNSGLMRNSRSDGSPEEELMVCVLCPNDKIGSMIGKGGSVVRKLREDSGAKIKVCDQVEDSDERIIQISAIEYVDSYASPVLEAILQVYRRLTEISADRDGKNAILSIRLLVRAHQIGCLLGKGGQIITEMRKSSRANIRIPPKDELPRCADEGSELVQVSGEPPMVEAALVQVLTRLRSNLFKGRDQLAHKSHHQGGAYGGRDDPVSPEGYSHDYGNYSTSPGPTRGSKDSRRRQR